MSSAQATSQPSPNAPSQGVTNLGRIAGAVGMVLLVSTPLTWLLTSEFGALVWAKLILGGALVGAYIATNGEMFARIVGARSTGLLTMSVVSVVVVLGVVGVVNFVAYKNTQEFDLTAEGLYTLSEQTREVLGRLQTDVHVMAFYSNVEPEHDAAREILERYAKHATRLRFEMIEPQNRPDLVEQYDITDRGPRIVVTAQGQDARAKEPSEQELTNAIVKVAEQTQKAVYFLTGHGEGDITDAQNAEGYKRFADAVAAEGYEVQTLSLLNPEAPPDVAAPAKVALDGKELPGAPAKLEIPPKVAVLVILGARAKLMEPEVAAIEAYLAKGGRVLAFLDPKVDIGLAGLLRQWKVDVKDDIIVDTNPLNRLMGLGVAAPLLQPAEGSHAITDDLVTRPIMMTARSVHAAAGGEAGVEAQALMLTGETAWGETNPRDGAAERDDADNLGPTSVVVVATREVGAPDKLSEQARLVVFGDSDFASNKFFTMQGNADFLLNAVNWGASREDKISIRPKMRTASALHLTGRDMGLLTFLAMDILPVLLVAMGLGIVLIRRQR